MLKWVIFTSFDVARGANLHLTWDPWSGLTASIGRGWLVVGLVGAVVQIFAVHLVGGAELDVAGEIGLRGWRLGLVQDLPRGCGLTRQVGFALDDVGSN